MKLGNAHLALEFEEHTGNLVGIRNVPTNVEHLAAPGESQLFRLLVPDEERWLSRHCVSGAGGPPEMSAAGDELTIRFPRLRTPEDEALEIAATVRVRLPADTDEALFTLAVENHSNALIHDVFFPCIGGWRSPGGRAQVTPGCSKRPLDVASLYHVSNQFFKTHRRRFWPVQTQLMLPLFDITGDAGGISYNCYAKAPFSGGLYLEDANERRGEPRPAWSWNFRPFIRPGASWQSAPVGIGCHPGDWHVTADRLRRWLGTWWRAPQSPAGLSERLGLFMTQFRDFEGKIVNAPEILVAQARECVEAGLDHVLIWDMMMGLYLRAGADGLCEDTLEHVEQLRAVLREIRGLGLQVSTYVNPRLVTDRSPASRELHDALCARGRYGHPMNESYAWRSEGGYRPANDLSEDSRVMCQSAKGFQAWASGNVKRVLDLGFSSFAFDQPFEKMCCFSSDHGHPVPAVMHQGVLEWLEPAVELVHGATPESVTVGENLDIWTSQHIDLNFIWQWYEGCAPEVYRYALPDAPLMWSLDANVQEHELSLAFAMGAYLAVAVNGSEKALSAVPAFRDRLRNLAALRRRTAEFTVNGRFVDTRGLSFASPAPMCACLYDAGGRVGVIAGEMSPMGGSGAGGCLTLRVDFGQLGRALPTRVHCYLEDGSDGPLEFTPDGHCITVELDLPRWRCAVLEIVGAAQLAAP